MVVTVSKELSDDLSCYYGSDYQHTFISNIIDVDFFAYHPRNRDNSHPFTFCCPAIFVDRKGFDVLFAAFDRLANIASDIRLLVCGHGTDSVKCQRMISNMEHKDKVCCLGELDKYAVRQMYYDSDALVLATRDESQGLVLLEAMSTGIPAISTKAIPQSVRIDSGFKYVDIDDADALMQEMLAAVRNPNDNGYLLSDRVRQFASSGVIGKRLSDLFSDIIALK